MYISQVCNVTADYHFPGPRYTKAPRRPNWNVCYRLPLKQVHKQWSWNKLSWSGHSRSSRGMVILFRIIMSHVSYFFLHVSLQSSQRYHPCNNLFFSTSVLAISMEMFVWRLLFALSLERCIFFETRLWLDSFHRCLSKLNSGALFRFTG